MNGGAKKSTSNTSCCVHGCKSVHKKNPDLSFHLFPKPNSTIQYEDSFGAVSVTSRRELWEIKLKIGRPLTTNMRVCQRHFLEEDYHTPGDYGYAHRLLKKTAVPSQNLPESSPHKERKPRRQKREKAENMAISRKRPITEVFSPSSSSESTVKIANYEESQPIIESIKSEPFEEEENFLYTEIDIKHEPIEDPINIEVQEKDSSEINTIAILDNVDEELKGIIRRKVYSFFLQNEPPTINKILLEINEDENLPNFKRITFGKLLREINFRFTKRNPNSVLKEKDEIIAWRRRFLRNVRKFREQGKKIYYLGETWVNAEHTNLRNLSGKGNKLMVLHIGSDTGFVENGLLLLESKISDQDDMNAAIFEEWFQRIVNNLDENCVIVMDNASYHSRLFDKAPTASTSKHDIELWLSNHNIHYEIDMVKAELLAIVKQHRPALKSYIIDRIARETGRLVLRLPPYHLELNPIELIWTHIKGEVARKNTTFEIGDVRALLNDALTHVTPCNWSNAVRYVIGEEGRMWELDNIMEVQVEALINNIGEDSSSESESE